MSFIREIPWWAWIVGWVAANFIVLGLILFVQDFFAYLTLRRRRRKLRRLAR